MESAILVDRNLNVARGMSKSTPSLSIAKVEHDWAWKRHYILYLWAAWQRHYTLCLWAWQRHYTLCLWAWPRDTIHCISKHGRDTIHYISERGRHQTLYLCAWQRLYTLYLWAWQRHYTLYLWAWSPNEWVTRRYVLGFAPALRLLRSQILCGLYKGPLDETINRSPIPPHRVYALETTDIRMLKIL